MDSSNDVGFAELTLASAPTTSSDPLVDSLQPLAEVEIPLLVPSTVHDATAESAENAALVNAALERRAIEALKTPPAVAVLDKLSTDTNGVTTTVAAGAAVYIEEHTDTQVIQSRRREMMLVGAAALELFIRINFTGPPVSTEELASVSSVLTVDSVSEEPSERFNAVRIQQRFIDELAIDGEVAFQKVDAAPLLLIARGLLQRDLPGGTPPTNSIWIARCAFVHQLVLENLVAPLKEIVEREMNAGLQWARSLKRKTDLVGRLLIEQGIHQSRYREIFRARDTWREAATVLEFSNELDGAMGARTKFQTKNTAQLVLKIKHGYTEVSRLPEGSIMPEDVKLDDDTRLEQIKFEEEQHREDLSMVEQATVLAMCANVKNTNPNHGLTNEEMHPYVNYVLAQPCDWLIQTIALWIRAKLEVEQVRARHRSLQQMENISAQFSSMAPAAQLRLQNFYALAVPPKWEIDTDLGKCYLKLGLIRDAVVHFERWDFWDEMTVCYQLLEQDGKAEALVRKRLEIAPTASLWCTLGDLKKDPQYYERAWEFSNCKSARAQRSLGRMYLMDGEKAVKLQQPATELYRKSVEAYQKAVDLNGMHAAAWFSLGCAAMRAEEWKVSCHAFRRKLDLEEGDFESWSNLARGYVMQKQKKRAFYAMREAVKHEYSNWKVWENFCVISIDVGAFSEVLRSINRLLDIRKEFDDAEILKVLLGAVVNPEIKDIDGRDSTRYLKQSADVVKRIKGTSDLSPNTWTVIANFHDSTSEADLAYMARRSAFQGAKSVTHWERRDDTALQVCDKLDDLVAGCVKRKMLKELNTAKLLTGSARKVLANAVNTDFGSRSNTEQLSRLDTLCSTLETAIADAKTSQ